MSQQTNQQTRTGAPGWAYFFVASGGGVVGHDYATMLQLHPVAGAAIGGIVSMIILGILNYVMIDPDGHIRKYLIIGGAVAGGFLGLRVAIEKANENIEIAIATGICAAIGGYIGQFSAFILALAASLLLLLSTGPVGLMVRTAILGAN